jgi:hypothetical protein
VIAAQDAAEKAENERKQAAVRQEAERICARERADWRLPARIWASCRTCKTA